MNVSQASRSPLEPDIQHLDAASKAKAGHYEILGETYAKFEFFENGWNPDSRFLDVDKVDLILRRTIQGRPIYREVQVKYGKLHKVESGCKADLFDLTSWRFFKEDEFADYIHRPDFFIAYVLAADIGYARDIFIFPVTDFVRLIKCGIPSKSQRKVYISRQRKQPQEWVIRRLSKFSAIDAQTWVDVTKYRRNFDCLMPTTTAF